MWSLVAQSQWKAAASVKRTERTEPGKTSEQITHGVPFHENAWLLRGRGEMGRIMPDGVGRQRGNFQYGPDIEDSHRHNTARRERSGWFVSWLGDLDVGRDDCERRAESGQLELP